MHNIDDENRDCKGEDVGCGEVHVQPLRFDTNESVEGTGEYEYGACNGHGRCD